MLTALSKWLPAWAKPPPLSYGARQIINQKKKKSRETPKPRNSAALPQRSVFFPALAWKALLEHGISGIFSLARWHAASRALTTPQGTETKPPVALRRMNRPVDAPQPVSPKSRKNPNSSQDSVSPRPKTPPTMPQKATTAPDFARALKHMDAPELLKCLYDAIKLGEPPGQHERVEKVEQASEALQKAAAAVLHLTQLLDGESTPERAALALSLLADASGQLDAPPKVSVGDSKRSEELNKWQGFAAALSAHPEHGAPLQESLESATALHNQAAQCAALAKGLRVFESWVAPASRDPGIVAWRSRHQGGEKLRELQGIVRQALDTVEAAMHTCQGALEDTIKEIYAIPAETWVHSIPEEFKQRVAEWWIDYLLQPTTHPEIHDTVAASPILRRILSSAIPAAGWAYAAIGADTMASLTAEGQTVRSRILRLVLNKGSNRFCSQKIWGENWDVLYFKDARRERLLTAERTTQAGEYEAIVLWYDKNHVKEAPNGYTQRYEAQLRSVLKSLPPRKPY